MKFALYLDAVWYCRHNNLPYSQIQRHGDLWKRHWSIGENKPIKRKEKRATNPTSRKTTQHLRCA